METLHKATEPDRAPVRILPPSEFGVVEMTRKRLGEPLDRVLSEPLVEGSYVGRRKKAAALACDALRQIERAAAVAPGKPITLQAAPEIVDWLNTYEEDVRAGLSRRGVARVTFQADATRSRDSFAVETGP